MRIGRESAYAIEGLLALAVKPLGTVMLLRDIASSRNVPRSFLTKIFQKLSRSSIVVSSRGAVRGYALARGKTEISLKEVLIAIEGPDFFNHCILWSDRCVDSNPCALHNRWKKVRDGSLNKLMERTTLADLAKANNPPARLYEIMRER
jgi:Rrf2 family protein